MIRKRWTANPDDRPDLHTRRKRDDTMAVPLHQAKAELFRTLGHPVRIRVLELLLEEPKQVRELLGEIEVEASNLSQQLAVLRRSGIVSSYREGATVMYRLSTPDVAELMGSARRILASMLTSQEDLLAELRTEMPAGASSEPNQT
ncbi:ArsR/SmtB family transcription factor [Demequina aestuarii]|uniref:ArsR/SmtB family transcription factor n=1 Tax=Demequina aestuarii TaxID=327095 RepID=UPI000B305A8C|nr:metalloregulator ArsR/SmtB family transcription factor [Demequina aestuarii]